MTTASRRTAATLPLLCLLVACSAADGQRLSLGTNGSGGAGGVVVPGAGGGFIALPDAAVDPLSVHVESPPGVTVEIVTLSCSAACADVEAVAHGGFAPHTFAWEDGSTSPARHLCPTASTTFSVSVTDAGSDTKEFRRAPETVTTAVTANVVHCPDGGATSHVDAGPRPDAGSALPGVCIGAFPAPVASGCNNPAGIVSLLSGAAFAGNRRQGVRLTGSGSYFGTPWHYELWGSHDGCSLDEQLSAFQLPNGPYDVTYCGTPTTSYEHVVLFYRFGPTDALSFTTLAIDVCDACTN